MSRSTSPEDAAKRLAAARAEYVPDPPKPTILPSHNGLAELVRDAFDDIADMRAQQYLWRHIVEVLKRAELAPAGLTYKHLSIAFSYEQRRREGRLHRKGKIVTPPPGADKLPRRLTLGVARPADGDVWAMALLDQTGDVLQDELVSPDGDYMAYIDATAVAGIPPAILAAARSGAEVAASLAERLATLALAAPVRLVTNDSHWPSAPLGQALFKRCGSTLEAYGAGIKIAVAKINTKGLTAVAIAKTLRRPPSPRRGRRR